MQPFDVSLLPDDGGIEVTPRDGGETASSVTTSTSSFLAMVTLAVANRYDHTESLWETLTFEWAVEVDGCVVDAGTLEPWCGSQQKDGGGDDDGVQGAVIKEAGGVEALGVGVPAAAAALAAGGGDKVGVVEGGGADDNEKKRVSVVAKVAFEARPLVPGQECWLTVTGRLRQDTAWAAAGHAVGYSQLELRSSKVRVCYCLLNSWFSYLWGRRAYVFRGGRCW